MRKHGLFQLYIRAKYHGVLERVEAKAKLLGCNPSEYIVGLILADLGIDP